MPNICVDHGMGLDGCTPDWEPGEISKAWLSAALFEVLQPDYRRSEPDAEASMVRDVADASVDEASRFRILSELIDDVASGRQLPPCRRMGGFVLLPVDVSPTKQGG